MAKKAVKRKTPPKMDRKLSSKQEHEVHYIATTLRVSQKKVRAARALIGRSRTKLMKYLKEQKALATKKRRAAKKKAVAKPAAKPARAAAKRTVKRPTVAGPRAVGPRQTPHGKDNAERNAIAAQERAERKEREAAQREAEKKAREEVKRREKEARDAEKAEREKAKEAAKAEKTKIVEAAGTAGGTSEPQPTEAEGAAVHHNEVTQQLEHGPDVAASEQNQPLPNQNDERPTDEGENEVVHRPVEGKTTD